MLTDLDLLHNNVHVAKLVTGFLPDIKVNPALVHRVQTPSSNRPGNKPTYRYIIAIQGYGRDTAHHELHDNLTNKILDGVVDFNSGQGNGITAAYKDIKGTAAAVLDIHKQPVPGDPEKGLQYSGRDNIRLKRIMEEIKGSSIVVVRGAFSNKKEFVAALNDALQHKPVPGIETVSLSRAFDPCDILRAANGLRLTVGRGLDFVSNKLLER